MLKNLFRKQEYITVSSKPLKDKEFIPNIPNGKWINCKKCKSIIYLEDLKMMIMYALIVITTSIYLQKKG